MVTKALKVIDSCETEEQLVTARKYCYLTNRKLCKPFEFNELIAWKRKMLKLTVPNVNTSE